MPRSHAPIPNFYRVLYTCFDPFNDLVSAYLQFAAPDVMLATLMPDSPRNPAHDALFHQLGGGLLGLAVLQGVLLRYTSDPNVWKIVQAAVLVRYLSILYGFWYSLERQGKWWTPAAWRASDWVCVGMTGLMAAVRLAFIAGVGFGKAAKTKQR